MQRHNGLISNRCRLIHTFRYCRMYLLRTIRVQPGSTEGAIGIPAIFLREIFLFYCIFCLGLCQYPGGLIYSKICRLNMNRKMPPYTGGIFRHCYPSSASWVSDWVKASMESTSAPICSCKSAATCSRAERSAEQVQRRGHRPLPWPAGSGAHQTGPHGPAPGRRPTSSGRPACVSET